MDTTKRPAPGTRTYDATVTRGPDGLPQLTIYQYIIGGVCGPHGDYPMTVDPRNSWEDTKSAAIDAANRAGYIVTSDWRAAGYAGVMTADVSLAKWS